MTIEQIGQVVQQPFGVILAGGQARRLGGQDKPLIQLGGRPLLAHVVDRFAPQVAQLALNANGDTARFCAFDLVTLPDTIDGFVGPLAGVLAGLDWAARIGADHVVSVAADTPFLPPDLVPRLLLAVQNAPIALAETASGMHPTCAIWPVKLRDMLRADIMNGQRRVGGWALDQGAATVRFLDTTPDAFFNINTPEDLALANSFL